jgi:hypothetical protein
MEKISLPVRIFLVVIVLAGAAGMLAMRTMGPRDEPVAIPAPVKTPAKAAAAPAKAKPAAKARAKAAPAPAEPAPAVNAPKAVKQSVPPSGFPTVVDRALREHEVVVLSLVVPGARVDELAAAEAEAGAKLGGAGFLALNVLNEGVARALLTKLETVTDPSVVVVKRSGEVALELTGFVDRETVAQAAANASS